MSEASFSKCFMRNSYIHSVLAPLSKCCPHLEGRLLTRYSPVRHLVFTEINTPFDLHVLSTPPAFVLSQDQTLQDILELFASSFIRCCRYITDGIFGWFHIWNPHSGYVHFLRNDYLYIVQFSKIRCRFSVVTVLWRLVYLNTFNRECQELFSKVFRSFFTFPSNGNIKNSATT